MTLKVSGDSLQRSSGFFERVDLGRVCARRHVFRRVWPPFGEFAARLFGLAVGGMFSSAIMGLRCRRAFLQRSYRIREIRRNMFRLPTTAHRPEGMPQ